MNEGRIEICTYFQKNVLKPCSDINVTFRLTQKQEDLYTIIFYFGNSWSLARVFFLQRYIDAGEGG